MGEPITSAPPTETAKLKPRFPLWAASALCAVACAAVLVLRKFDALVNPQLWADDAIPFCIDSLTVGLDAFRRGYAGYYHLLPRLIAWLGAFFDPCAIPTVYVYASLVVTFAVLLILQSTRIPLPRKGLLALAVVAVPHTGEIFLTPTNLQWITALALFVVALSSDPRSKAEWAVDLSIIIFAGLSGPFCILTFPFFVIRAFVRRSVPSTVICLFAVLPCIAQAAEYVNFKPGTASTVDSTLEHVAAVLAVQIPLSMVGARNWAGTTQPELLIALGLFVAAVIVVISFWRLPRAERLPRVMIVAFAAELSAVAIFRLWPHIIAIDDFTNADRYFVLPRILLLWLLCAAADVRSQVGKVAAALLVTAFLSNLNNFVFKPLPDLRWNSYCEKLRAGEAVTIPINPGWEVQFPRRK
jgi:hypothetical protein